MAAPVCRDCGARILWATNERNGRRIPLDEQPTPDGAIVRLGIADWDGTPMVQVFGSSATAALSGLDRDRWTNHLQTCTKRKRGRKP